MEKELIQLTRKQTGEALMREGKCDMKKRIYGILKVFLTLAVCFMLPISGMPVMAAPEMPDPDRTGSLSITFTCDGNPISGGNKVSLYKVADVIEDNGYKFVYTENFASAGEVPEDLDAQNEALSEKLEKIVKNKNYSASAGPVEIDEEGKVVFDGLNTGLYLVVHAKKVQIKTADGKSVTYTINPFLVSIPQKKDGTYIYDVTTKPKVSPEKDKKDKPDNPDEPEKRHKRLPQTGQLWWPVMLLGAAGAVSIVIGLLRKRKED